jgi:hypothetical protein
VVLALVALQAAAWLARRGWALGVPLAGIVPVVALGWIALDGRAGWTPYAAIAGALAVALVAITGVRAAWSLAPSPEGRVGLAAPATIAALVPAHAVLGVLLVTGDDRFGHVGLAVLIVTVVLAGLRREAALVSLAGFDVAVVVFQEAGRLPGTGTDFVAMQLLALAALGALVHVLVAASNRGGDRLTRAGTWIGRNRAVLGILYTAAVVVGVAVAIAGITILVRDPLVREGVRDLADRFGGWIDHLA